MFINLRSSNIVLLVSYVSTVCKPHLFILVCVIYPSSDEEPSTCAASVINSAFLLKTGESDPEMAYTINFIIVSSD